MEWPARSLTTVLTFLVGMVIGCGTEAPCRSAECVEAPEGWHGPDALMLVPVEQEPALCPAPFVELGLSFRTDLRASDAVCACDCAPSENEAVCARTATVRVYDSLDEGCTADNVTYSVQVAGECGEIEMIRDRPVTVTPNPRPVPGATCEAVPTTERSPVSWDQAASLCALPSPAPDDALVCVWTEGDVECPGTFDARHVLFDGVDDTRGCTECTCADGSVACDATVTLRVNENCLGDLNDVGAGGDCLDAGFLTRGVDMAWGDPVVTCEPTVVTPTGRASGANPVTACCVDGTDAAQNGG